MSKKMLFKSNVVFMLMAVTLCGFCSLGQAREPGGQAKTEVANDAAERYRFGLAAFRSSKFPEALSEFESVAKGSTGYLRLCATNMVGQVQRLQGRSAEARSAFASMAKLAREVRESRDSSDAMARNAAVLERLALHYQAEIAQERQDWDSAIPFYEQLILIGQGKDGDSVDALCVSPALMEKLGRLYWRTGRHDKAREIFTRYIESWPTDSRVPLIKLALIALEDVEPSTHEAKLAFVVCPIGKAEEVAVQRMLSDDRVTTFMPELPAPHNPARDAVERLLKELPPENVWRPVVLCEMGWMLFEDGKYQESALLFTEASRLSGQAGVPTWQGIVGNYADLSRAIILLRQGKNSEGKLLADGVLGLKPRGHVQTLASSITASFSHRHEAVKAGAKCAVQKLE